MKKICIISGPALGHLGRLYKAAERLREHGEITIHFLTPARCVFADQILAGKFTYFLLPDDGNDPLESAGNFALAVEAHFKSNSYDMVMLDANPMRWFSLIKFPDVPKVFITNAFLTSIYAADTVQSRFFIKHGERLNNLREERGIAPLSNAYEIYDADKVLLADPLSVIEHLGPRPAHYIACGPCSWEFDGNLPDELCSLESLMLLSMGSTGPSEISSTVLKKLFDVTGSRTTVYAGSRAENLDIRQLVDFAYQWLPLNQLLPKCSAVVSQGGAGSTYQALMMGCPLLVLGRHQNHLLLADLLQEMGLALRLDSPEIMNYLTEDNFERLKSNVKRFAEEERDNDGSLKICSEVHQLLRQTS